MEHAFMLCSVPHTRQKNLLFRATDNAPKRIRDEGEQRITSEMEQMTTPMNYPDTGSVLGITFAIGTGSVVNRERAFDSQLVDFCGLRSRERNEVEVGVAKYRGCPRLCSVVLQRAYPTDTILTLQLRR